MRKRNGKPPKPRLRNAPVRRAPLPSARSELGRMRRRLARVAAGLLAFSMLAGCATTRTTVTTARAQCAAWRAITYASQHDTAETVRQVRVHNRTGQKLRCWQ